MKKKLLIILIGSIVGSVAIFSSYSHISFLQTVYAKTTNPVWVQHHFRFRDDDGNETTATWAAAEDTNITGQAKDTTFRIRIQTQESANQNTSTAITPLLEYKMPGTCGDTSGWTTIDTSCATNDFCIVTSSNFADKDATTAQLSSQGGHDFVAGEILETSNPATANTTLAKSLTEHEWAVQANSNAGDDRAYILRLSDGSNNTNYNTYDVCAQVTTAALNSAPTLSVSQPDGTGDTVNVGDAYNITYTLDDTDDIVTVAFYYDSNNTGLDGTAISGACATAAEGTGATCSWDTTGMTPGSYYVYGITDDGTNPAVNAYSSGQITINSAPVYSVSITSSGSIAYGFVDLGVSTTTAGNGYTQTANHDGSGGPEKLNVKSSNATGGTQWTLGTSAGSDIFKHEVSTTSGATYMGMDTFDTYITASSSVAVSDTVNLDFRLTVPTASTDFVQKSITITVQAVAP